MTWQRARSVEQKNSRVQAILDTTEKLLYIHGYEAVSMKMIALEAGFTRSNLYRYFQTKEEIFVALISEDFQGFFYEVKKRLEQAENLTPNEFAILIYNILSEQERLLHLQPMMAISLEHNSSSEVLYEFKQLLNQGIISICEPMIHALPYLNQQDCFELFFYIAAVTAGLYPMTSPNDTLKKVLENPELCYFKVEFKESFISMIERYVLGMRAQKEDGR